MRTIKLTITLLCLALALGAMANSPYSLERAIELYRDGRWVDSNLELLKVKDNIKGDNISDLEGIDYYIAMCAIEMDNPESESYLTRFEARYPSSVYANQVRFARAMLYCSDERYDEAKSLFELVNVNALSVKEREKYNIRMGYILFCEPDYEGATPYFKAIDAQSDIYYHALYYLSYIDYVKGDNVSARKGFTELLSSNAYRSVSPYYLLQIEFNDGRYDKVITEGEELYPISTDMRKRELSRAMAEAAFRLEEYDKTISYLDRYRENEGVMRREENYLYGFSLYRSTRYEDAVQYLRDACGADVTYQAYNCKDNSNTTISVQPKRLTIVEGSYSLHSQLSNYYSMAVVLSVDATEQRFRLKHREDSQKYLDFINKWVPLEDRYMSTLQDKQYIYIDTSAVRYS